MIWLEDLLRAAVKARGHFPDERAVLKCAYTTERLRHHLRRPALSRPSVTRPPWLHRSFDRPPR
ncbi:predicted protein [Streptomyces viridosporus ATCC 14672]|uniref:Predicted protein n=1 Tax=Streptomyces viridosporus (strain ATCC 14672 / DSM 40746 / JCM 4963 / KCTC 9882 / NRRL B-12104 / FH 1290) TaxID=566461 RepID=D6A6Z5_STRV1|nr:predicted protein [Streptomyces viridosporus ATCC 14672]